MSQPLSQPRPSVVLITGHPATGKTTLAYHIAQELNLPLICKDQIKEVLVESLGAGTDEWLRKLSGATWDLLYQQVEMLLKANVPFIVESNFDPAYANQHWQNLAKQHDFRLIQIGCATEPETLLKRYIGRIESSERHKGHVDASRDPAFLASIEKPFGWIDIEGPRLCINTTDFTKISYSKITKSIKCDMSELSAN